MSVGIKETKEALVGVNEIALHVARRFKDGVQFSDFPAFYADLMANPEYMAKLQSAWENYQAIPEEVKDLDIGEIVDLTVTQASYVPKIIGELIS